MTWVRFWMWSWYLKIFHRHSCRPVRRMIERRSRTSHPSCVLVLFTLHGIPLFHLFGLMKRRTSCCSYHLLLWVDLGRNFAAVNEIVANASSSVMMRTGSWKRFSWNRKPGLMSRWKASLWGRHEEQSYEKRRGWCSAKEIPKVFISNRGRSATMTTHRLLEANR